MTDEPAVKYSSYTEAQKKATQKYRIENKEKVNLQRKNYYIDRKEKDPSFLDYKRLKAREYYIKRKAINSAIDNVECGNVTSVQVDPFTECTIVPGYISDSVLVPDSVPVQSPLQKVKIPRKRSIIKINNHDEDKSLSEVLVPKLDFLCEEIVLDTKDTVVVDVDEITERLSTLIPDIFTQEKPKRKTPVKKDKKPYEHFHVEELVIKE